MEPTTRRKRKESLARRLNSTNPEGRTRCWVFGCQTPPGNTSSDGLGRFCRRHLEHLRRHGDALKPSYKAAVIAPYRKAAKRWIASNRDDHFVKTTLRKVEGRMAGAGRAIEPRNLRGVSVNDKARSVWARLQDRETTPEDLLAAILGVAMCAAADRQPGKKEYRQVQIGKLLSRMGGGVVKRWPTHNTDPNLPREKVLRWFPASEGLVLRELGRQAEAIAEFIIPDRLEHLVDFAKGL